MTSLWQALLASTEAPVRLRAAKVTAAVERASEVVGSVLVAVVTAFLAASAVVLAVAVVLVVPVAPQGETAAV